MNSVNRVNTPINFMKGTFRENNQLHCYFISLEHGFQRNLHTYCTVLPAKSDSGVMLCLQSYQDLESIYQLCINSIHRIGLIHT